MSFQLFWYWVLFSLLWRPRLVNADRIELFSTYGSLNFNQISKCFQISMSSQLYLCWVLVSLLRGARLVNAIRIVRFTNLRPIQLKKKLKQTKKNKQTVTNVHTYRISASNRLCFSIWPLDLGLHDNRKILRGVVSRKKFM